MHLSQQNRRGNHPHVLGLKQKRSEQEPQKGKHELNNRNRTPFDNQPHIDKLNARTNPHCSPPPRPRREHGHCSASNGSAPKRRNHENLAIFENLQPHHRMHMYVSKNSINSLDRIHSWWWWRERRRNSVAGTEMTETKRSDIIHFWKLGSKFREFLTTCKTCWMVSTITEQQQYRNGFYIGLQAPIRHDWTKRVRGK